ncbi:uncharacterized protein LOC141901741 [Tubulanus polymorphus]|uniref:uncharacterized protein LOC141901741 n=1 Tax=Tubulanus polymorphus TaxID=672921 RepID=UPI003DA6011C
MVLKQMQHRFSAPAPGLNSLLPSFPPKSVPTFSTPAPIFAHHQVTKFTSQSMPMFAPQQHSQLMSSFHPQMHTTLSPQMPSAFNFSSHSVQSPFTMQANTSFTPHSNLAFTPQANHSFVPHSNPTLIPQSKTTCNPHENCFCRLNQQVNPTFPPHPAPKFNAQTLPVLNPSAFNSLPVSSHFPILPSTLPKTATPMPNVTANRPNSLTSVAAITPYISTRPASASSETSFNFPASEAFEFGNHQNQSYKEVGSNEKLRDEKRCKDGTSFTTTFTSPNDVSSFAIGPGLMKVSRGTTTNNISYDDASCNTISIRKKDFSTQVSNIKPSMSTVTVNTVESVFDEESDYYLFTTEKSKTVETCDIGTNTRIIKTKSRAVMTREMKRDHHRSTQTKPTMDYDKLVQRSIKAEMKVLELQAEKCIADHLRTKCDLNLEFNKRKQLHSIDISNEQLTKIEAKFSTMISNIEVEINRINDAYFCNKKKLTASICLADLPLISSNYVKPDIEELFKAVGEKKSSDISNVKVVTQGEIQSEKNKRNSLQSTLDKEVEHALSDIAIPDLDNGAAAARCLDEPKLTTGQKQPKRPSPPPGLSCSLAESFDELQINNPISSVLQDPVGNMLQDPVGMQKAVMARLLQQNPLLATNPQLLQMLVLQEVMGTLAKANVFNAVPVSQTSSTSSCASLGAPSVVQFSANQAEYQSSASASLKSTRRTKQLRRPKPSTIAAMLHSRVQKPKQQELEKASTETELTQPSPSVDKSLPAVDDELESHGIRSSEPTAKRYRSGSVNRVRFRTLSSSCPENQPPSSTTSSRSHSPINSDIFLPEYWQRKERSNSRTPSPSLMRSELDSNWRSPSKSCNVTNWRSPQKRDVMNYRDVMTASGDNNNTQSKSVMERKSPVQALHEEEKEKSCNGVKEAVSRSVNNQSKPAKDDGGWEKVTKRKRNDSKSQSESGGTLPPSRTARESVPSVSKTNFDKLVGKLATKFPTLKRNEAVDLIKEVRKRRKGTLVGMTMSDILKEADSVFATMSTKPGAAKVTNLAPAKSSTSPMMQPSKRAHPLAVNQSSAQVVSSKSKLDINFEQNECTICFETLSSAPLRILDCGHTYHELCIKQWIYGEDATCPVCRNHTLLPEDFPKLS